MNLILQSHTFLTAITLSARVKAEQFSLNQSNSQKAQQVYKNTLAVFAVNTYLNYSGWVTSLSTSNSWNPIMQSLMEVADLDIPEYGKVECCLIDDEQDFLVISPEARANRIAYIAVRIKPCLQLAEILGFIPQFSDEKILLSQLQSIFDLPSHLESWKQQQENPELNNYPLAKLKQWLVGVVEEGWYNLEEIFYPTPNLGFRSPQKLQRQDITSGETLDEGISRVKLLNFNSTEEDKKIALILYLQERIPDLDISVKVCPINRNQYLPKGLEIFILDQKYQTVMHAHANKTKNIEFRFSAESGEYFSIKACLNQKTHIETFTI